jgi:hypothetical protein
MFRKLQTLVKQGSDFSGRTTQRLRAGFSYIYTPLKPLRSFIRHTLVKLPIPPKARSWIHKAAKELLGQRLQGSPLLYGVLLAGYILVAIGFNGSRAANLAVSIQPEDSTVTAPATVITDASASGGKGVQFGSSCALPNFPDASCTGVPAGTTLTIVNGNMDISTAGTEINGKDIRGCVNVTAPGVIIKNSKIACDDLVVHSHVTNGTPLTIQDSELTCNDGVGTAIGDVNIKVLRVHIHGCENGFDADSDMEIRDSYIHDLFEGPETHTDGLQSAIGSNMIIDHNTIYDYKTGCHAPAPEGSLCNGTAAVNINNSSNGPVSSNTTISNNLLAGGAYTLYCPIVPTSNFRVINNHFTTIYGPKVGEYGPATSCGPSQGSVIQSGNVIHETGQTITLD